ncbi:MAG: glycoside hydrolase family 44 protein [Myxococcaceae bacterium]
MNARSTLVILAVSVSGFQCRAAPPTAKATRPAANVSAPQPLAERIWSRGLQPGWNDFGWAPHDEHTQGPVQMSFAGYGGWILAHAPLEAAFGGVRFRAKIPASVADALELRFDSRTSDVFPRVRVSARHRLSTQDGWTDVFVPMEELNPEGLKFDRIVIRAAGNVPNEPLTFDDVGLTAPDPKRPLRNGRVLAMAGPTQPARLSIDCAAPSHPISPMVYGIAFAPLRDNKSRHQWTLGATARRWGGNPTSRYNWELGNAWNTASDYFYRNVNYTGDPSFTYERFLNDNLTARMQTALTVPLIGWVAKDTRSVGFPRAAFGPQREMDPDHGEAGNGIGQDGKPLQPGPPTLTSVAAPPEFVERWLRTIQKADEKRGRSVHVYMLDNEPMLWNDTHRDVHPQPTSYDELLSRTLAYAAAVRRADPDGLIAGPALWGWPAYFGSAVDHAAGASAPDRRAHGNVPLLAWYLRQLRAHEKKTGERLLDLVDVHFYPQAKGVGINETGRTDEATSALRIRSTRALWDPTYKDESWIAEPIMLIPRLKQWIAENYPGRGIVIGEYNFGAETHMSGGIALAEALGRLGEHGVTGAFYWTYPAETSPAAWAFRAFRNYDGKGAQFLDQSVPARSSVDSVSVFASTNSDRDSVVLVILNKESRQAYAPALELNACSATSVKRVFSYQGEAKGLAARPNGTSLEELPPYSITVMELRANKN